MIEIKNKTDSTLQLHAHQFWPSEKIEINPTWYIDEVIAALVNQDFIILKNGTEVSSVPLQIELLKGELKEVVVLNSIKQVPFADADYQGKRLFLRGHGTDTKEIAGGATEVFTFINPYEDAILTGIEVVEGVTCIADLEVKAGGETLAQFGHGVLGGRTIPRHCQYGSRLVKDIEISVSVKNTGTESKLFGVNFYLHELRST